MPPWQHVPFNAPESVLSRARARSSRRSPRTAPIQHGSKAQMGSRKIGLLRLSRRWAVAGAIVVGAEMRAAFDHAARRLPRGDAEADEFGSGRVDGGIAGMSRP